MTIQSFCPDSASGYSPPSLMKLTANVPYPPAQRWGTQGSPVILGLHGVMLRPALLGTLKRSAIGPFWGQGLGLFSPFCDPSLLMAARVGFYHTQLKDDDYQRNLIWLAPDCPARKWQSKDLNPGLSDVKASCHFSKGMHKGSSSCAFQVPTFTFPAILFFPVKFLHTYFHVSLPTGCGNTSLH